MKVKFKILSLLIVLCATLMLSGCMTEDELSGHIHDVYTNNDSDAENSDKDNKEKETEETNKSEKPKEDKENGDKTVGTVVDEVIDGRQDIDEAISDTSGKAVNVAKERTLIFFKSFRSFAPVVIFSSLTVGVVLLLLVKSSKKVRGFAWKWCIFAIPLLTLVFVYGFAYVLQSVM